MSARYKVGPDDPEVVHVAQRLIEETSGPVTTWVAQLVTDDTDPKLATEAAAIAFATELSLIGEHMTKPINLAKQTWTALVCQRIYTHMTRLLDAEEKARHVSPTPAGPNESIN